MQARGETLHKWKSLSALRSHKPLAVGLLALIMTAGIACVPKAGAQVTNNPPDLALLFERASYGGPEASYNTVAVENADLNMLLSVNPTCIRIDIGYAPWLQGNQAVIDEMTSLVQAIRAAGKCLIIADAASETYRNGGQLPWSEFMTAWVSRVSTLAALYHPDYYVVVKEPGWYVPLVSDATTNPQFKNLTVWLSLTKNLTQAVTAASPSTRVGVAIAANSLVQSNGPFYAEYLNEVQTIPGLSFIGFDIYGQGDQTATLDYLANNPPSKTVWVPEAWSTATGAPLDNNPSQDAQWASSMYSFASSIHAAFLIPFYTDHFASYSLTSSSPTSAAQILSLFQQRTPIFTAFQSIQSAAIGSTSSSSSSSSASSSLQPSSSSSSTKTAAPSSASSSVATSATTPPSSAKGGGGGTLGRLAIALVVIVLIALIGAVLYFRRRS